MAASLGTAVHASVEDLLQVDLTGRNSDETHWLPELAEKFLKQRWEEEKEVFFATPRRPMWKEKEWDKAKKMQRGAIKMLLEFIGVIDNCQNRCYIADKYNYCKPIIDIKKSNDKH